MISSVSSRNAACVATSEKWRVIAAMEIIFPAKQMSEKGKKTRNRNLTHVDLCIKIVSAIFETTGFRTPSLFDGSQL